MEERPFRGRVFDAVHERPLGPVAPQGLKPTLVSVDDAALEAPLFHGNIGALFVSFGVHGFSKLDEYESEAVFLRHSAM